MALLCSCGSPLKQAVKTDAPAFTVRLPASTDQSLGSRLRDGQPTDVNPCFRGDMNPQTFSSWSNRTLRYDASGDANLAADFGKVVTASVGGSGHHTIGITLMDMLVNRLDRLYFDASSSCATDETMRTRYQQPNGVIEHVITQVLGAGSIEVNQGQSGAIGVKVHGPPNVPVSVGVNAKGEKVESWKGVNLYIAHLAQPFKVTLKVAAACRLSVATGMTCDLDSCSIKIDAVDQDTASRTERYTATLSCEDGTVTKLSGQTSTYAAAKTAPGVSYSLRLRPSDVAGTYNIDFFRWNVLPL